MGFIGRIECPDCQSPIGEDTYVCPYCHSMAPASGPWRSKLTLPGVIALAVVACGLWIANQYFGVDVLALLQQKD